MTEKLKQLMEKVDSLTLRERGIILAGILFVVYSAWQQFLMAPQAELEQRLASELQRVKAEQSVLNFQYQNLISNLQTDPNEANRERLSELKMQLETVEDQMVATTNFLVEPGNMASILRSILNKSGSLELIAIRGLGASPLVPGPQQENGESETDASINQDDEEQSGTGIENAFKHGLVIEFEGTYMSTLEFLKAVESLEWEFIWDSLDYEVKDYPIGKVALTLYTVSLGRDWIGA